jgi:two-component system, NarL family, response regulator DevR
MRILIVDDHAIAREGLKTILRDDPDFDVVAESGSAAGLAQLVQRTHPDVVLLDARLPGVSGAEACRQLVAADPDVAVLMVSSYSDDRLVEECIRAGAKGYVVKDIERLSLKESIRAVYGGGGAVSPVIAAKMLNRLRSKEELASAEPSSPLSHTQLEILRLIAVGFSNREIAGRVHLSENTVKSHTQQIFRKLDVGNRVAAAIRASKEGWL